MAFLDESGLAHFWEKVKAALSGKQNTLTAGDGLSKEGDTLNVDTPVRGVYTQEEYDALPEEQRNKGLYVIPGTGGSGSGGGSPEEIYSTEETRIGTWIDGKPLYRKLVTGKSPASQNVWTPVSAAQDTTMDVKKYDAYAFLINSYRCKLNYFWGNSFLMICWDRDSKQFVTISINDGNLLNLDIEIWAEYTKTTDDTEVST